MARSFVCERCERGNVSVSFACEGCHRHVCRLCIVLPRKNEKQLCKDCHESIKI